MEEETSHFRAGEDAAEDARNLSGSLDRDTNLAERERRISRTREDGKSGEKKSAFARYGQIALSDERE